MQTTEGPWGSATVSGLLTLHTSTVCIRTPKRLFFKTNRFIDLNKEECFCFLGF